MDATNAHPEDSSRPPTIDDLVRICAALNEAGASYLVVGGMAMIRHGHIRTTEDVDLLIDASPANVERVKRALAGSLPDRAAMQVASDDIQKYTVVRVADEIVVDLMENACGIGYAEGSRDIAWTEVKGVRVPFASAAMLWRMKQTLRDKDVADRMFLSRLIARDA